MNYYEHHIGDFDQATAHLTACEDGIYSRLIRRYYATEKPLPSEISAVQRLVRARTKDEKQSVSDMLSEFFILQADGWHNVRCDEEIAHYRAGEPERELRKANEDNRVKRHRDERARLFRALTDAGQHAPWNIGMTELRALVTGLATAGEPKPVTAPATAPVTPATATQAPIPNTHTPVLIKSKTKAPAKARAVCLPQDFGISDQVRDWATDKGHVRLDERLSHFIGYVKANGKMYVDWDQAFMNAIRDDWAKLQPVDRRVNAPASKTASALMSLEGMKNEPASIQHSHSERPAEIVGFIPPKHATG